MIDWKDYKQAVRVELSYFDEFGQQVGKIKKLERPTQTKPVKDAVEWSDSKWVHADRDVITYSDEEGFSYSKESYSLDDGEQIVCTYEQFEAYVKEQEFTTTLSECAKESEGILKALAEQEGEKWTHIYRDNKCRVIHQEKLSAWIEIKGSGERIIGISELKPIKPTISESDEAALVKFMESSHKLEVINEVRSYIREHDIT
jgi:hypothetical protein